MEITRKADLTTIDGPEEYFTGKVTITGQFQRPDPSRVGGAIVRFEPGARTAWHSHPAGQTLIVTQGIGWTQVEGGPKLKFYAGDILWCPAEHKHWHGATPHEAMTHIAIQESVNGTPVSVSNVTDLQFDNNSGFLLSSPAAHKALVQFTTLPSISYTGPPTSTTYQVVYDSTLQVLWVYSAGDTTWYEVTLSPGYPTAERLWARAVSRVVLKSQPTSTVCRGRMRAFRARMIKTVCATSSARWRSRTWRRAAE